MSTPKDRLVSRGVRATLILGVLVLSAMAPGLVEQSSTAAIGTTPPPVSNTSDVGRDVLFPLTLPAIGPPASASSDAQSQRRIDSAYGKLPLSFEANHGQTDSRVTFVSRGRGYTMFLTPTEAVFVLIKREGAVKRETLARRAGSMESAALTRTVVRMKVLGSNPDSKAAGLDELPGKGNYFIGNDPQKWRTNVPTYARVEYRDVYPGVSLVYYGNQRELEYDFVVRSGADPRTIALEFEGAERLEIDAQGDLVLHTAGGALRQRKPVVYQEMDGARREIAGGYVLKGSRGVGFQVAAYDSSRPLIIDPALSYSTYLGGSSDDSGRAIAVDASGSAYVTGETTSTDFPITVGAFQTTISGAKEQVFVTKLNPTGSALVYSTYIGGNGNDSGRGIAVDALGQAYVTGPATSRNFPTTVGAFQTIFGPGSFNAFVTKLDANGSGLIYSTFVGSGGPVDPRAIAVDSSGSAYVTGRVDAGAYPTTTGAFQPTFGGGRRDAFVTKVAPTGSALVYSTYLGGGGDDWGFGIDVDASGNAYVAGNTGSTDFPTTAGAFQTMFAGATEDGFVTKLDAAGGLVYSTYLGGEFNDSCLAIAVDATGNAYVTGQTGSTNFPTTAGAFQTTFGGVFVTKLDPTGSAPVYSTYLGGTTTASEVGFGIAVDASGNAYVTGHASSTDFPTTAAAFQTTSGGRGDFDAFITKLNSAGSGLLYSTLLGGDNSDAGVGIALDALPDPNAYVVGITQSTTAEPGDPHFPTTAEAFQTTFGGLPGLRDTFVAKIAPFNTAPGVNVTVAAGDGVTVTFGEVLTPGDTGATMSSSGPAPPAGFTLGDPPAYYDVQTSATFVPPVSLCITYDPSQFDDPSALRLFHFEGGAWADVTTTNDTGTNVICGEVTSFSPFVIAQRSGSQLTSLGPANIWVGLKNSDDVGIRFDLRAEVYRNDTQLVGSGEVASVPGGSSGFNNARQDTITLTPVGGVTFSSGDRWSIKLYVRNACSGSGKNSGTARLWFNDSGANSRFDATIGDPATYFLRDAFALATTPGPGPRRTIDVAAGAKCSPYKTFGTWSTTLP